jgi:hypothetical protein
MKVNDLIPEELSKLFDILGKKATADITARSQADRHIRRTPFDLQ